eukprot:TRINITY_DN15771_c4_g1_i1.p1 TRINITY_DN15771_c4_g1~~TRINITY_DN15771_c4_g1_i1.p1  ORF type:complete len:318 (-),score=51.66 TRINITY_DN15771_c4_g1_i1:112-1065(-)
MVKKRPASVLKHTKTALKRPAAVEASPKQRTRSLRSQEVKDMDIAQQSERLPWEEAPAIFGISQSLCYSCGSSNILTDRAIVELGHVYCKKCWAAWEKSGSWRPSIRVSTTLPPLGSDRLPIVGAEDVFCLPAFLCAPDDFSLMDRLQSELKAEGREFSEWHGARHMGIRFDKAADAATHKETPARMQLVSRLEAAFGIEATAVRLNFYRANSDYKPLHYDRGRDSEGVPQLTVGASFGSVRELTMLHVKSGLAMSFPQRNGDVFAFTPEINQVFMHGVPIAEKGSLTTQEPEDSPRMSLIIWGAKKGAAISDESNA